VDAWTKRQPPYVEIALATAAGSTQGAVLGGVMGAMTKLDPEGAGKLLVPPTGGSDAVRLSQRFWRCPTTVLARSKPAGGLKADHHSLRCESKGNNTEDSSTCTPTQRLARTCRTLVRCRSASAKMAE